MAANSLRLWITALLAAIGGYAVGAAVGTFLAGAVGLWYPSAAYALGAFCAVLAAYIGAPASRLSFSVAVAFGVSLVSFAALGTRRYMVSTADASWLEALLDRPFAAVIAGCSLGGCFAFIAWRAQRSAVTAAAPN